MSFKIIILDEAKNDFKEIITWYKKINPLLSKKFANSFNNSLKKINKNPYEYQIRYDNVRVFLLKTFPYLVHFSIENQNIFIKAVLHTSRDNKINNF
jgi:plasmid stabilization system protein ParE